MRDIFNLQNSCVIKVKASGIPDYSILSKYNKVYVIKCKNDLFTGYAECRKKTSSLVRHSEK